MNFPKKEKYHKMANQSDEIEKIEGLFCEFRVELDIWIMDTWGVESREFIALLIKRGWMDWLIYVFIWFSALFFSFKLKI